MQVTEKRYDDELDDTIKPDAPDEDFSDDVPEPPLERIEKPSIWQTIRRFFYQTRAERDADYQMRLVLLNEAIATYPTAAVNYLLRGELYLDLKLPSSAKQDFERAIDLAEQQFDDDRWGLSTQAIRDRAQRGLHRLG